MLDIPRIRAVLFDIDGTLSDTDDAYLERALAFARPLNLLWGKDSLRPLFRRWMMASEEIASALFIAPDVLGLDEAVARGMEFLGRRAGNRLPDWFRLIEGIQSMLEGLSRKYALGIVTSRDRRNTEMFLERFSLSPLFQTVVTAFSAPHIKPHPAPVLAAARALGVGSENCLMVGDTRLDILAGKRAGAQTAGVLCGFGRREDLVRAGADVVLATTGDLADALIPQPAPPPPSR
jgi:HAD superfamily hydrolase (TIGR01509 family)